MTTPTRRPAEVAITTTSAARTTGRPSELPAALRLLEPDDLHPGRIAGPYAWAAWNLTTAVPQDRLTILLPHRDGPRALRRMTDQLEAVLGLPHWREPGSPRCSRRGTTLSIDADEESTTIQVRAHLWYLPQAAAPRPGPVVDRYGYPIIDEFTALRERLEHTARRAPNDGDIADLRRWVAGAATVDAHRHRIPTLRHHLGRLRRDAPIEFAALEAIIRHARRRYTHLPDRRRVDEAFALLTRELAHATQPAPLSQLQDTVAALAGTPSDLPARRCSW